MITFTAQELSDIEKKAIDIAVDKVALNISDKILISDFIENAIEKILKDASFKGNLMEAVKKRTAEIISSDKIKIIINDNEEDY